MSGGKRRGSFIISRFFKEAPVNHSARDIKWPQKFEFAFKNVSHVTGTRTRSFRVRDFRGKRIPNHDTPHKDKLGKSSAAPTQETPYKIRPWNPHEVQAGPGCPRKLPSSDSRRRKHCDSAHRPRRIARGSYRSARVDNDDDGRHRRRCAYPSRAPSVGASTVDSGGRPITAGGAPVTNRCILLPTRASTSGAASPPVAPWRPPCPSPRRPRLHPRRPTTLPSSQSPRRPRTAWRMASWW